VARADARIARHVDALDINAGRDLPVDAHLPGHHEHHRAPIEADDDDFIRLRFHDFEQVCRKIGPCRVQHRVALGREFGAHNVEYFGRQLVPRIE
jgi:hypothetical protein